MGTHAWLSQRIAAGDSQYDSWRLVYPAHDKVNEIEVEILKTKGLYTLSLAVHGQPIRPCESDPKHAFVKVRIGEECFRELASLHAGGQRLKLSPSLQEAIIAQLQGGGEVNIELPGYSRKITADNFPDLAKELENPSHFHNPIQLSF